MDIGRLFSAIRKLRVHARGQRATSSCASRGLLSTALPLLPGRFQLAVAFRVNLLLPPRQHVVRRDVAGGTVQADVVVMVHVALDQTPCIVQYSGVPGECTRF